MIDKEEKYSFQEKSKFSPSGVGGTILVTGGTGFLGSYIIKQLVEKGYSVRAIRRSAKLPFFFFSAIFDKVEWVEGDVLDIVALEDAMEGIRLFIQQLLFLLQEEKEKKCTR